MPADLDDLDEVVTKAMNDAAAAEARLTCFERVVNELNSGYGDTTSGTRPYKDVLGATLESVSYDLPRHDIFAKISVNSDQQSPNGDMWVTNREFIISRQDAHRLASEGPHRHRATFAGFAVKMDEKFSAHEADIAAQREQERIMGISATVKQMAQLNAPVAAPTAARFRRGRTPL
jgi:hypothetical protein